MNVIKVINTTNNNVEIDDLCSFEITASGTEILTDYFSNTEISKSDNLITMVADGILIINDGEDNLSISEGIKYCLGQITNVNIIKETRDRSGKLRVHQTSRKLGLSISWSGAGDDTSNITNVYRGESLTFEFNTASGIETMSKYIDFNIIENETWLHEGYITWKNCHFEKLTLRMLPRVTSIITSSGTNYDLYDGYLIVPAYPGTGTIDITSDITDPKGGLIYMPNDDLGNHPTNTFWNADWNSTTKKFENISAAPAGDGRYNMFAAEVVFAEFLSQMPLLANGFIALNSSDTDQMGQGMRLKMILEKGNHNGVEEIVAIACLLCLHREKSV